MPHMPCLEDILAADIFDTCWLLTHLGAEPVSRAGALVKGEGWIAPVRLALTSRGVMFATHFDEEYTCFRPRPSPLLNG